MQDAHASSGRWRTSGLVTLGAIVLAGLVAPGYFHWKAPEIRARRHATQDALAAAPKTPAGRLYDWTRFGGDPQIHNRLLQMRFSFEQPWLVTHAIAAPPGASAGGGPASSEPSVAAGVVEIVGIDLTDMPRDLVAIEGLTVVLRLPQPSVRGRGLLRGDHAAFVPVYPDGDRAPDAVARAREIVGWALDDLGAALERDIPGARLVIEIGPETDWSGLRARAKSAAPANEEIGSDAPR